MSVSTPKPKKPLERRPRTPSVQRLDSLSNPQPRPPPTTKRVISQDCPNPACEAKNSGVLEDGKTICGQCGTVIAEGELVTEVLFGLASGGQHIAHGFHVGANEEVAKRGAQFGLKERQLDSRQQTEQSGKHYMTMIGQALSMPSNLRDMGMNVFRLCIGGFIQGRRVKSVAAVAIYIACRKQQNNQHMLIDFADVLQIDVFNLGHVYKCMLEHIDLQGVGAVIHPINPEDLVLRFAQRLEFGKETLKVANDAVRIVQRMNRDWMTPGRRPAGICGAALILAARMNNYRRTVREVVYVVKVQEQTIFNRLDEFRLTESSGLTVEEFRNIDLERTTDPPAFYGKNGKKKRGRKRKHMEFGDDGDNDRPTVISSRASSAAPSAISGQLPTRTSTQQARADSRSMLPPPIPIDPSLERMSPTRVSPEAATGATSETATGAAVDAAMEPSSASPPLATPPASKALGKRKRGRPPKSTSQPALDADITAAITNPLDLSHATALLESASSPVKRPETQPSRPNRPIPDTEEISDSEFATDLEVVNCLLTPTEVAIKTRLWTHENRDYLRAQRAKALKQELAEANGTVRVIVRRRRKKKRMGDMSTYGIGEGQEGTPVAETPADAVIMMMGARSYSRKLNYDAMRALYEPSSRATSSVGSPRASISDGGAAGTASPGMGPTMSGALPAATASTGGSEEPIVDVEEMRRRVGGDEGSVVGRQEREEQQKELESIVGALEEEGINVREEKAADHDEEDGDEDEDEEEEEDDDDDDDEPIRTMYDEPEGDVYESD